jgi:hypothetical protein
MNGSVLPQGLRAACISYPSSQPVPIMVFWILSTIYFHPQSLHFFFLGVYQPTVLCQELCSSLSLRGGGRKKEEDGLVDPLN